MTNNYVLLNGKLSRDIEVTKNDKGNSFVKFCLICTRDGINSYSDYINCIAFGEIANAICRKGEKDTAYHIEGNIRTNSYEKNGKKNYSTNVVVESFRLLWMPRIKRCPFCHSTAHVVIDWNSKKNQWILWPVCYLYVML